MVAIRRFEVAAIHGKVTRFSELPESSLPAASVGNSEPNGKVFLDNPDKRVRFVQPDPCSS